MRRISTLTIVSLVFVSLPLFAQDRSWTRQLKDRGKREALHDRSQPVRGDSGKWNDDPRLQHAPPIEQKPAKLSLDDWADQVLKKEFQPGSKDDNWLIFRSKQLDDNDRIWVQRIERQGHRFTVVANQAVWQGRYRKNFTYYQVIAINLGKLEPGKYEVKWALVPLAFTRFDGDGRPRNNWPKDEHPTGKKAMELPLAFTVGKGPG
jgi:hypothetical protein